MSEQTHARWDAESHSDGVPKRRAAIRNSYGPATPTKRQALDDYMSDYHDERHTGTYVECNGCTEVHIFFQENPSFYQHL